MIKKLHRVIFPVLFLGVGLFFFIAEKSKTPQEARSVPSATLNFESLPTPEKKIGSKIQPPIHRSIESTQKDEWLKRKRFSERLKFLDEHRMLNNFFNEEPQKGMISKERVLSIVMKNPDWSHEISEQAPSVTLVKDIYIVEFWKPQNPFRDKKQRDLMAGVDAWTGELFDLGKQHGGMQFYSIDKETVPSKRSTQRMKSTIKALDKRAVERVPLNSEFQQGMIPPEAAVKEAMKQMQGRDFDRSREPQVVLVDAIYMVVFWRHPGSTARHHEKLYNTRVGIDAHTGEFIAMEITKEKLEIE